MDTSENYIEMCSKSTEIQGLKKDWIDEKSFIVNVENFKKINVENFKKINVENFKKINVEKSKDAVYSFDGQLIWLPRQDQLQEMIFYENRDSLFITQIQNESMEIAWLAFVMKEKFNKIWNEEKEDWELIKI